MKFRRQILLYLSVAALTWASTGQFSVAATYVRAPEVRFFVESTAGSWKQNNSFYAYDQSFTGGGSVAMADLGKDGVGEIVTGAGLGGEPHVRTFRLDGSFILQFYAYDKAMTAGVNVAAGDVDGDGAAEIVTGPKEGGGPHIRVFDGTGRVDQTVGFFAFDQNYKGGVNVATGDVDGDGKAEIIVGSGIGMEPTVKIFSVRGAAKSIEYHPFAADNNGGVSVAAGNVDNDAADEIFMAVHQNGEAWVKVYDYNVDKTIVGEFKVFGEGHRGGVNIAAGDMDGDGKAEVVVGVQGKGGPQVKIYEANGKDINPGFFAYEEDFHSGVNLAVGKINKDSKADVITIPGKLKPDGRTDVDKYVRVDLSEQRMYAYEQGYLVKSFLISSGLPATPTPPGEYHIQRKIYSHLYSGPGYYLPNTLYNLQFRPHYYLHGAYWHNNFGHPMSHGCVNISYANAEWLYNWMDEGDLAVIEY
ncbi:MAG TPA: hypothetical protein DEG44_01670 [Candidatus Kerfeldbacteria bacterium]|nr:hypothetical protein [Candidatus Kerfeldbacteria bacterium]